MIGTAYNRFHPNGNRRCKTMKPIYVGAGKFRYEVDLSWDIFPANGSAGEAVGVACDSRDRVYVFLRGPEPVRVFERNGTPVMTWGAGVFVRPHGIFIGPDDTVYCTDDFDHTVRAFSTTGELQLTLGVRGQRSDTGATSVDYRTIQRAGPPFNYPTNLARAGGRSLCRGRLRQRAHSSLCPRWAIAALLGRTRQRAGTVPCAARHRRRSGRDRVCRRPRE